MKREDAIDFHSIRPEHGKIHERLLNWARWVGGSGRGGTATAPMFRQYRSTEVWQQVDACLPVDTLDGSQMEKQVGALPEHERGAVRWHYVYSRRGVPPWRMCRVLGVSAYALEDHVHRGRTMIQNRL